MSNIKFVRNVRELLQISCNFDQLYSKMEENPSQICEAKSTISGTEGGKATKPQRYCTYCRKVFKQMQTGRMKLSEYREERTKWESSDENRAVPLAKVTPTPTENKWDIPGCKGFSSVWSLSIWYWEQHQKYRTSGSFKKFYHATKTREILRALWPLKRMRAQPRSQSPLNDRNISVPKSVLMLEFIFTLKKVKTQVQPQPSKLHLSWITTNHFPHPALLPFAVTRDSNNKGRIVTRAQNTGMYKWPPHVTDENICQDRQ